MLEPKFDFIVFQSQGLINYTNNNDIKHKNNNKKQTSDNIYPAMSHYYQLLVLNPLGLQKRKDH